MTPQELKLSILRRAFQGKLADQIFEEGSGADLLPIIQSECHNKIINGQIKKFKAFPEITDEDSDFDVPDNWQLVRLGEVCQLLDGEKRAGETYPYLEARYLRGKTAPTIMTEGKYIAEGTNVILVDGENSGEVFRISEDGYMGSTFKVLFVPEALLLEYVINFFQLHKNTLRNNKKGAAIPHLNKDIFFNLILPIPPLAEQKRIVAKIEELLPLIDRYEQAWSRLEDFNKRFPVDMQKSILQMAIQGKLVPQLPEEGTGEELFRQIQVEKQRLIKEGKIKKEKPLPEIAEDEIPFDIPESWKWVRLGYLAEMITSGSRDWARYYSEEGDIFLRMGNLSRRSFNLRLDKVQRVKLPENAEGKRTSLQAGDLLFSITGEVGTLGLIPDGFGTAYINQHTAMIRFLECERNHYIPYLLLSDYAQKFYNGNQHGIKNSFRLDTIAMLPVPLPPLDEQKRIVSKLEEILPLCERLK